ncbi:transcriptional regulator [Staphylococcus capitis]|mgnify:CR=1 FL=1|nr:MULTISPECIES: Rha family transcriptional regulator [Staphylococcus]MBM6159228.1 Rha family transcriptional regulator [Staphylococcus epidermidis]MBM6161373.1 Rha family transcriptional regulator [Staphylococcus epidermidis]MBM6170352.1 Rha family transcriptional regulator [Staphylococcus epidermidis]MBM6177006.1 Rha family transcriptional regulator [Staphylococcus epidermidis]MBM6179266.1 Rha family transcriptional regulator [Staphylococcus epidermidis]
MQDLQVVEQNNEFYVDSREVAEMVGKRHDHLIRDIKGYIEVLEENPKLGTRNFFEESTYITNQNKIQPCYLLTKKGCDMVANKMTGSKGVLFTAMYVDAFHKMDEHIKQSQLNVPQTPMQALEMMFKVQKDQEQFNKEMKREITGIRNIVGIETKNWRNDTNKMLGAIAQHLGGGEKHQKVRIEAYKLLEEKGRCKLEQRLNNRKAKMLSQGATKSQINKLSKLDVITDEPRLIEIYISVIKSMAIKYGVDVSQFEL